MSYLILCSVNDSEYVIVNQETDTILFSGSLSSCETFLNDLRA